MADESIDRQPPGDTAGPEHAARRSVQPLVVTAIVIAGLYFGRPVFEPLALALAAGADPRLDAVLKDLADLRVTGEAEARQVATRLALALQASLLVRYAPAPVADAFCATRLPAPAAVFGLGVPSAKALVDRAAPVR